MKWLFSLGYAARNALRSLWAYRLRTFLTGLGVMMGVATVIAILAIIDGLNSSFKDQISQMGTGTLYVSQMPWIIIGDWWKYMKRPPVTLKDVEHLEEHLTRATYVVPFADTRSNIEVGHSTLNRVRVIGSVAAWSAMSGIEPIDGRFIAPGDVEAVRQVIAVGADVANAMKREGFNIGDNIQVAGRPMKVISIMAERGRIFGQSQDDFVVIPLTAFERIFGTRRSITVGVVVDPDELDIATDEITGLLRTRRKLKPYDDDNFSVNQQQMFVDLYRELTRSLFATAIGLGLITLIVGGVGIMNVMLVAVAERTKEIGIRKALGARPGAILLQFVVEAGTVSGVGGAIGTTLGLLLAKGVSKWTPLPAEAAPSAVLIGIVFGIFIGVSFGFLPAYRASKLVPVVALSSGE